MPEPPNQTLQFFLNLLWRETVNPKSDLYLPKLVLAQRDPAYEPYTIDGSWHLANSSQLADAATRICAGYDPNPDGYGTPDGVPDIWLLDPAQARFKDAQPFTIHGISNLVLSRPVVSEGTRAKATATVGTASGWPYGPLTVLGNWTLSQQCTDSGKPYQGNGYGHIKMVIKAATIDGQITVQALPSDQLQVVVDALDFKAAATAANIVITVELLEIADPALRKMWDHTANLAFTDEITLQSIVKQIAAIINSETTRAEFGAVATSALRQIIDGDSAAALTWGT